MLISDGWIEKNAMVLMPARCAGAPQSKNNNVPHFITQPALWHYSFNRISATSRRMR
jgi:hypothetical protein